MFPNKNFLKPVLALCALLAMQPGFADDKLADSAAVEIGTGSKVQMVRFSAQKNWQSSWFERNGSHISGYWDANLAQWRGNAYQDVDGQHQNITVINLTPVFRYERADKKGWYAEGGIGVSLFSNCTTTIRTGCRRTSSSATTSAPATSSTTNGNWA